MKVANIVDVAVSGVNSKSPFDGKEKFPLLRKHSDSGNYRN
jgi:hypothetical protein